jgi:AraC-like DNA-binding protein
MASMRRISRYQFVDADIDEIRAGMPKSRECVLFKPIGNVHRLSIEGCQFSVPGFDIWKVDCGTGIEARFNAPPDAYALFLPIGGAMEVSCRGAHLVSRPGTLIASEFVHTELTRKHEGRSHIGISFDRKSVRRQLTELLDAPVVADVDLAVQVEAGTRVFEHLMALGDFLWRRVAQDVEEDLPLQSTLQLFKTVLVAALEGLPHRYSTALARPVSGATPRQVKRAIDFMIANLGNPMEIADIARQSGVSVRALQAAFQQFKHVTPLEYLRRLRLDAVRQDLLENTGETISDIARRRGFTHMGRFSATYRQAFGELPTQTCRGRRLPR